LLRNFRIRSTHFLKRKGTSEQSSFSTFFLTAIERPRELFIHRNGWFERNLRYVLNIPLISVLLLVSIFPLLYVIYLGFTDANMMNFLNPKFVGLQNYYSVLIRNDWFVVSLALTLGFVSLSVTSEFAAGLVLALIVSSLRKATRITVVLLTLPLVIAPVILGNMFRYMLHSLVGVIPFYLEQVGIKPLSLTSSTESFILMALVDVWMWTPFLFLIAYASLQTVPQHLIDAALVDGASRFGRFRYVVWPSIVPNLSVGLILRIIDCLKTFDVVYILTGGGIGSPVGPVTFLSILIYKITFSYYEIGVGASLSVLTLIFLSTLLSRPFLRLFFREEERK